MSEQFTVTRIPGLFYMAANSRCYAGHAKILGLMFYSWHNEAGQERGAGEWADHRAWSVGLIALHHVTPGTKSTNRAGWSLTFAGLYFKRIFGGFEVTWRWADRFRTRAA